MAWSQARAGTAGGPQTPARHPLISVTSGSSAWISPEVPLVEWNVSFRGLRWVIGSNEGGACSTPPPPGCLHRTLCHMYSCTHCCVHVTDVEPEVQRRPGICRKDVDSGWGLHELTGV